MRRLTLGVTFLCCLVLIAARTPALTAAPLTSALSSAATTSAATAVNPTNTALPTATTLPPVAANTTNVTLQKILIPPIAGKTASIDHMVIDQAAHLLYVGDRTSNGIDIFDVSTPSAKYVTTVDTGSGPNGVIIAADVKKVFVGLNDSNVAIIDIDPQSPRLNTVIAKLNTGGKMRADALDYDPTEKKVYINNSDDGILTVIDADKNTIIKQFNNLGDGLQNVRYNPSDGMIYMVSAAQNALFQFDPRTDTLVKKSDVGATCDPNGLAINPATSQALFGCSNVKTQQLVAWDLKAAKVLATFDQVGACDIAIYNAKADRFLVGCRDFYRGGSIAILGGNPIKFITNVPTGQGSGSVAFDETNNIIYTQDELPNEGSLFSFPISGIK